MGSRSCIWLLVAPFRSRIWHYARWLWREGIWLTYSPDQNIKRRSKVTANFTFCLESCSYFQNGTSSLSYSSPVLCLRWQVELPNVSKKLRLGSWSSFQYRILQSVDLHVSASLWTAARWIHSRSWRCTCLLKPCWAAERATETYSASFPLLRAKQPNYWHREVWVLGFQTGQLHTWC